MDYIKRIRSRLFRNDYGINDIPSQKGIVNIENYPLDNVGDYLGPIIVNSLIENAPNLRLDNQGKTRHLMSVGSIVSMGYFDATIWGSGLINEEAQKIVLYKKNRYRRKLDIRAVRGPLTRKALIESGYVCPEVYGDPAILLPNIYPGKLLCSEKKISLILHYRTKMVDLKYGKAEKYELPIDQKLVDDALIHYIDPKTHNYKSFIDQILKSNLVISSSLHGIILAEAYGVPAVFLNYGVEEQMFKFNDWYLSTHRQLKYCSTIEEALDTSPNELPDLSEMRENLLNSFPYDLWEQNEK